MRPRGRQLRRICTGLRDNGSIFAGFILTKSAPAHKQCHQIIRGRQVTAIKVQILICKRHKYTVQYIASTNEPAKESSIRWLAVPSISTNLLGSGAGLTQCSSCDVTGQQWTLVGSISPLLPQRIDPVTPVQEPVSSPHWLTPAVAQRPGKVSYQ
ncbi:hypothetical protein JX266_006488 [Neoarthrinium moseri]|nr:hypothetical protein JX266_006488 [Neoarthrinium moseri]